MIQTDVSCLIVTVHSGFPNELPVRTRSRALWQQSPITGFKPSNSPIYYEIIMLNEALSTHYSVQYFCINVYTRALSDESLNDSITPHL